MSKLWREPLVHFVVLGAILFVGHGIWQARISKTDYEINISTEELERQAIIFAGENRRQPTDEDLKALLFAYVEEQVLMREAQKLGLGEDDTIIRRRLAQKMRFMIEDVDGPETPDDDILRAWFNDNQKLFLQPERRAFTHIFLSPQTRGDMIEDSAEEILESVNTEMDEDAWRTLGDPFMMKREYEPLSPDDATRLFGKEFTAQLFGLEPNTNFWQGPIESAFGLHVVRIDEIQSELMPEFNNVRQSVLASWLDQTQRMNNQNRLKKLISKYDINVEGLDE